MVEGQIDAGSNCLEDINSASWQDGVQGLSYVPSLEDDENMNTGDEEVEILLENSAIKPVKKPYVRRVPSLGAKVSSFFSIILKIHSSFYFWGLNYSCGKQC
jgi:hypothetical protein